MSVRTNEKWEALSRDLDEAQLPQITYRSKHKSEALAKQPNDLKHVNWEQKKALRAILHSIWSEV
eukprot:6388004-Amphidinium_carterae.1